MLQQSLQTAGPSRSWGAIMTDVEGVYMWSISAVALTAKVQLKTREESSESGPGGEGIILCWSGAGSARRAQLPGQDKLVIDYAFGYDSPTVNDNRLE